MYRYGRQVPVPTYGELVGGGGRGLVHAELQLVN